MDIRPTIGYVLCVIHRTHFFGPLLDLCAPGFFLLVGAAAEHVLPPGRWAIFPAAVIVFAVAITFTPWKRNGLHPSKVLAQVNEWNEGAPVLIQPAYYEDTYAWQLDKHLVQDPSELRSALNNSGIHPVNGINDLPKDITTARSVLLVDAWSGLVDPAGSLKLHLKNAYQQVDSMEADRKVWVYRFRK